MANSPFHDAILQTANEYRIKHQAPELVWDNYLAEEARKYALLLVENGKFAHSNVPDQGENLFEANESNPNHVTLCKEAVNDWYVEADTYDFNSPHSNFHSSFTTLVWKSSTQFGAGWAKMNGRLVIVGRFHPKITSQADFEANILPPK